MRLGFGIGALAGLIAAVGGVGFGLAHPDSRGDAVTGLTSLFEGGAIVARQPPVSRLMADARPGASARLTCTDSSVREQQSSTTLALADPPELMAPPAPTAPPAPRAPAAPVAPPAPPADVAAHEEHLRALHAEMDRALHTAELHNQATLRQAQHDHERAMADARRETARALAEAKADTERHVLAAKAETRLVLSALKADLLGSAADLEREIMLCGSGKHNDTCEGMSLQDWRQMRAEWQLAVAQMRAEAASLGADEKS
jgi:hypothetical protein